MSKLIWYFLLTVILIACGEKESTSHQSKKTTIELSSKSNSPIDTVKSFKDSTSLKFNLVDIQEINSTIKVDLKYASSDNFMKIKLYDKLNKVYLQRDVAIRLGRCQAYLNSLHPNLSLLVYDGVRPVSVQQKMWDALDSIPVSRRGLFVSNPKNRSVHNFGAAVDLTICDQDGIPLDMGAGYDDMNLIAYPSKESYFLEKGMLTKEQVESRQLLRKVMRKEGFTNIPSEWWHFNACSRKEAIKKYKVLLDEF